LTLDQNYRRNDNILQAANHLIGHTTDRVKKKLWSKHRQCKPLQLALFNNEREEALWVAERILYLHRQEKTPLRECALFYRTHFQSRTFEDALLAKRIPYVMIGGISFYQRKEVKDILSYLRLVLNEGDFLSFTRTIHTPKRGIGEVALGKLAAFAQQEEVPILTAIQKVVTETTPLSFNQKQQKALRDYVYLIASLKQLWEKDAPIPTLVSETIARSGYLEYLKEDPDTEEERKGNLADLVSKAVTWEKEKESPSLAAFLEELSLYSSAQNHVEDQDSLQLMTLHNSKGLEFQTVFMVGMEETLFPHINAQHEDRSIEEERRLCYVGMTRAKNRLLFTAAYTRFLWGTQRAMHPSRFLKEIPPSFFLKNLS
jgi:DNA helicase II / ATP-dependent DNA helicase PcrA